MEASVLLNDSSNPVPVPRQFFFCRRLPCPPMTVHTFYQILASMCMHDQELQQILQQVPIGIIDKIANAAHTTRLNDRSDSLRGFVYRQWKSILGVHARCCNNIHGVSFSVMIQQWNPVL